MLFGLILILLLWLTFYNIIRIIANILYYIKINNKLDMIQTKYDLLYMKRKDYEKVIMEMFKRKGYKVRFSDRFGEGDNGFILDNIQYVQAMKDSLKTELAVESIKKFNRCMQRDSIYRGIFITLGDFKNNTRKFCHKNVIKCINGDELLLMCKEVQGKNILHERLMKLKKT